MEMKKFLVLGTFLLLIGLLFGGCTPAITQEDVDTAVSDAVSKTEASNQAIIDGLKGDIQAASDKAANAESEVAKLSGELESASSELEAYKKSAEEAKAVVKAKEAEYAIDELPLDSSTDGQVTSRDLKTLFDGQVEFDDEDYDAEESIELDDVEVSINEADYQDNVYMTLKKGGISYLYTIENSLDVSDIDEDESLIITLLGEEVEIVDWASDSITLYKGVESTIKEGESVISGDATITAKLISDDYVFVTVKVGDESESAKIYEGDSKVLMDVEVRAKDVLDDEDGSDYVTLSVGEEVKTEIEDGDEYDDDSIWNWVVDGNTIGLTLNENFRGIDEDYSALAAGESVCLPNNYVCVRFDGLAETDKVELQIEDDIDYDLEVSGDFKKGLKEYDKVYVNASGIYDDEDELIDVSEVEIDGLDDELSLVLSGDKIVIDTLELKLDFSSLKDGSDELSGEEDSYITAYGITIDAPEDSMEDEDITFVIPENEAEASVSVVGRV
jgi:outer membrane murein-binding lipoprotein Lpp